MRGLSIPACHCGLGCGPKAGNPRHILGSGPPAELLSATAHERLEAGDAVRHDQRADALVSANLVRRDCGKICSHYTDIERYFAERLDCVDVQHAACLMDDLTHLRNWLKRAGLVIGRHD